MLAAFSKFSTKFHGSLWHLVIALDNFVVFTGSVILKLFSN